VIHLHRLNGSEVVVNADLIESIDAHGIETVIMMATGNRYVVKEAVSDIIARTVAYRQVVGAAYLAQPLRAKIEEEKPCH